MMMKVAAQDCACLICGAVPGMPCTGASGKVLHRPHLWRTETAREESAARAVVDAEIVESLRRQSEFYAANPRVDATPEWDDV